MSHAMNVCLTLLHSEWPKLYRVLAILSAIGLKAKKTLKGPLQKSRPKFDLYSCSFPRLYLVRRKTELKASFRILPLISPNGMALSLRQCHT